MACIKPRTIVNRRYVKLAGSSFAAEVLFRGAPDLYLVVDCGRCLPCQKKRSTYWRQRLVDEYRYLVKSDPDLKQRVYFVTLTIAPKYYQRSLTRAHELICAFRERYRKRFGKSLRYWICSEYGEKRGRLHLHAIFFNPLFDGTQLESLWQYGRCDMSVVGYSPKNPERDPDKGISYVTKYVTKYVESWFIKWSDRSRIWCSPGLGLRYCLDPSRRRWHNQCGGIFFRTDDSGKYPQALPRYYVQKLFSCVDLHRRATLNVQRLHSLPEGPFTVQKMHFESLSAYWDFLSSIGGCPCLLSPQFDLLPYDLKLKYLSLQYSDPVKTYKYE